MSNSKVYLIKGISDYLEEVWTVPRVYRNKIVAEKAAYSMTQAGLDEEPGYRDYYQVYEVDFDESIG